jgi:hypothetical protein
MGDFYRDVIGQARSKNSGYQIVPTNVLSVQSLSAVSSSAKEKGYVRLSVAFC